MKNSTKRGRARVKQSPWVSVLLHIILGLILGYLVGGCQTQKPDLTWRWIQEQGVIRVGMDANWVPFGYIDGTGQLSGFDVELAREIGERLELEVQFVANLSFDGLYDALTAGLVDALVSAVVVDIEQSADFLFSTPYFDAGQVLLVGPNSADIESMKDLGGRVLAVELGSDGDILARRWARRLAGLTLLHTDSSQDTLVAVAAGQADAALADRATALMALKVYTNAPEKPAGTHTNTQDKENRGGGLRISGPAVTGEQYAVVVRQGSDELLRAINATLADMHRDGTLKRLEREWLGP